MKRLIVIDIYKGIGILLMIAGHAGVLGLFDKLLVSLGFQPAIDQWIHAFHMPMFFFVSGYLFRKRTADELPTSTLLIHKTRQLILPYVFWGLFHYLIFCILSNTIIWKPLCNLFFINSEGLPIAGALWFLSAMFFASTVYFLIDRYLVNVYLKFASVILLAICGCLSTSILPARPPYSIDAAFVGMGLMLAGESLKSAMDSMARTKVAGMFCILCFAVCSVLSFFNPVNMRTGTYGNMILFWLNAIGLSMSLFMFLTIVLKNDKIRSSKITRLLSFIGENSIYFLILNELAILLIKKVIACCSFDIYSKYMIGTTYLSSILIVWLFCFFWKKTPLTILFGKEAHK